LKLVFSGDRKSRTIKFGKRLRKILPGLVKVMLWDGYGPRVYFERRKH